MLSLLRPLLSALVTQAQAFSAGIMAGIRLWMHPLFRTRVAVLSILMVHFIVLFVLRPVGGLGLPYFQSSYPFCFCWWSGIMVRPPLPLLALAPSLAPPYAQVLHSPHIHAMSLPKPMVPKWGKKPIDVLLSMHWIFDTAVTEYGKGRTCTESSGWSRVSEGKETREEGGHQTTWLLEACWWNKGLEMRTANNQHDTCKGA
jgi:hypothetical protein